MNSKKSKIFWQITPNPHSRKFLSHSPLLSSKEGYEFSTPAESQRYSILVFKLFHFPWVKRVFLGFNFLTIDKQEWLKWEDVQDSLCTFIEEHLDKKLEVMNEELWIKNKVNPANPRTQLEEKIYQYINQDIRPALQMDGGDLEFKGLSDKGVLKIRFRGACSTCPSSSVTLNNHISHNIKEVFKEVSSVEIIA